MNLIKDKLSAQAVQSVPVIENLCADDTVEQRVQKLNSVLDVVNRIKMFSASVNFTGQAAPIKFEKVVVAYPLSIVSNEDSKIVQQMGFQTNLMHFHPDQVRCKHWCLTGLINKTYVDQSQSPSDALQQPMELSAESKFYSGEKCIKSSQNWEVKVNAFFSRTIVHQKAIAIILYTVGIPHSL